MRALYDQAALAARSSISVLVLGETGAGKELLARFTRNLVERTAHSWASTARR
jgi:DNA-binding NtrC family response regulator